MIFDSEIKIGKKKIGSKHPTFITFEAGPTHNGLESAKELAKLTKDSGADAIKFQILDSERLMADKSQIFSYNYLDASKLAPLGYFEIITNILIGYIWFSDIPDKYTIIGLLIIILSGVYVFKREQSI